jgi:hypothetical protein
VAHCQQNNPAAGIANIRANATANREDMYRGLSCCPLVDLLMALNPNPPQLNNGQTGQIRTYRLLAMR